MRIIGGLEIGTSKVTVIVGELTRNSVAIIGKGECQSHGVVKGTIVDIRAASNAVHTALEMAEKQARMRIGELYLAQTGKHLEGFRTNAVINVSTIDNSVSQPDIDRVCSIAKAKQLPENRLSVAELRLPFYLDGNIHATPLNIRGQRLESNYWMVHGDTNTITNSVHIINDYNLQVQAPILSSLASGMMITTAEDRQHGVLAIDIGAGTTDFALYRDGCAWLTGVVPVGGSHITNDLQLGIRLTEGQAEAVKLRCARATATCRDRNDKIWLNGDHGIGDRELYRQSIEQITALRIEEIFQIVKKKLGHDFTPETLPAGVVLTGGTSKLPGITDAAQNVFQTTARLGEFAPGIHEQLRTPGYATVLGLIFTVAEASSKNPELAPRPKRGLFDFLKGSR